jgi:hypothetical protein
MTWAHLIAQITERCKAFKQLIGKLERAFLCAVALYRKALIMYLAIMNNILKSLTLEQAYTWFNTTDKWIWIDDNILSPHDLTANNSRVEAIEATFDELLLEAEINGMKL